MNIKICEKCQHLLDVGPDIQHLNGEWEHYDTITLLCTIHYNPVYLGDMNPATKYFMPAKDKDIPPNYCPFILEHTLE